MRQIFHLPSIALALLIAALGLLFFSSTCGDDANITWYAARAFSEFGEFQNYDGERVEQSSSIAHVLAIAGLHKLTGLPIPDAAVLLSLFFAGACVMASMRLASRISIHPQAPFFAGLLTATCYPLAYWSVSGLDATMAAATFSLLLLYSADFIITRRRLLLPVLMSALYLCTRPEGFFVWASTLGLTFLLVGKMEGAGETRKRIALLAACALAVFGGLLLFRHVYFGRLFPEPVYIKAAELNFFKVKRGIKYLLWNLSVPTQSAWALLAGWAVWRLFKKSREESPLHTVGFAIPVRLFVAAGISLVAYLLLTGGDWMENGRYLVIFYPAMLAFVAHFLLTLKRAGRALTWSLAGINLLTLVLVAALNSRGRPLWAIDGVNLPANQRAAFSFFQAMSKDGERDIPAAFALDEIYTRVAQVKKGQVTVMSGQAGLIIAYLAEQHPHAFRWIDLWGLTDRSFTDCPPSREIALIPTPSWDYKAYFRILPAIHAECPDFVEPDIIFEIEDIGQHSEFHKHGYRIVYFQKGWVDSGDEWFPGIGFDAGEIIAVREDLAEQAGLAKVE